VVVISLLGVSARLPAEDWPCFRGPNCNGIYDSSQSLPLRFSDTEDGPQENVVWSVPLGDSVSSPVVAAGRVFTSAMVDEETVGLFAFDAVSGMQLWQRTWETGPLASVGTVNSYASSTPAADNERVYFYFTKFGMRALDAASGEDVWHTPIPEPFFAFGWGPDASPVLYKDMLLFCQDDDLYPALHAFDKRTGKVVWSDDRLDMNVNYSQPVICTNDGVDEIVVAGTGILIGHEPKTGERKWWAKVLLRNIKTTPVSHNGIVYVMLGSGGIAYQWLATADTVETGNSDGMLTREEIQASVKGVIVPEAFFERIFGRGDLNRDGYLEGEEIDLAFMHPDNFAGARFDSEGDDRSHRYLLAVRVGGRGDVTDTHVVWHQEPKRVAGIPSPLLVDGRLWNILSGGLAICHDVQDGDHLWTRRINSGGNYYASPVYGDGKIYLAGENGYVTVLENGTSLKVLAKNDLGDDILGTPAIAEGRIYIRTRKKLVCVGPQ